MGNHVSKQNDHHELVGIGQSDVRSTEETEYGVEENQAYGHEQEAYYQVQRHGVAKQVVGCGIVFLPQLHGDARRRTYAYGCSERTAKVHEREGDAQTGYCLRPDNLPDERAVDDVVERRCRHGYYGRHGILRKQTSNGLRSQLQCCLSVIHIWGQSYEKREQCVQESLLFCVHCRVKVTSAKPKLREKREQCVQESLLFLSVLPISSIRLISPISLNRAYMSY